MSLAIFSMMMAILSHCSASQFTDDKRLFSSDDFAAGWKARFFGST